MPDFLDLVQGVQPDYPQVMECVRTGKSPTSLLFFTREAESAELHYVDDPTVRSFVLCPGAACPLCHMAIIPEGYALLPALNLAKRVVQVLRVSSRRGAGSLASALIPHLRGEGIESKLFRVTREGFAHNVTVQPLGENADRCEGAINGFLAAKERGLSLLSAFPAYSAAELAEIPEIRHQLDADGRWPGDAAE